MIIKYIIGLIVGYILSSIISIILTVLRVGIPMCNSNLKYEKEPNIILALKLLRKKYFISLVIWIPITVVVLLITLNWANSVFVGCLIALFLQLFNLISMTGKNDTNIQEFNNSLICNINIINNN